MKEKAKELERIKKGLYVVIRKHDEIAMTEKVPMDYVNSFVDWAYEDGKKEGRESVIQELEGKFAYTLKGRFTQKSGNYIISKRRWERFKNGKK